MSACYPERAFHAWLTSDEQGWLTSGERRSAKVTKAVVVGAVEQTIDLNVNPYDGSWNLGEIKDFWIGKDEGGFQSFRATGTISVRRTCIP